MIERREMLGDPAALSQARAIAHCAVQPLSLAERANLAAVPDDSHSNLGWDLERAMFTTHPLGDGGHRVCLSPAPLTLYFLTGEEVTQELPLIGVGLSEAEQWLDARLEQVGLRPTSAARVPYELPEEVARITKLEGDEKALKHLAEWYALAGECLEEFAANLPRERTPGPSPVRCWPHHFDIATYVGLAEGDPETAKGIGVGLSPGDESYDQPYFYVNPWPHLDPSSLPEPVEPGHWHTEGFVGLIATGREILTLDDIRHGTVAFLRSSFDTGCAQLGD